MTNLSAPLPKSIGPYNILGKLGEGACATVYLAQKSEDSGHKAVKVLHPEAKWDTTKLERFKREWDIISAVDHPFIIKVFDFDFGDENSAAEEFFIAMEYIPGGTLSERLETGPLHRNEAIHIVKCIGEALTYFHNHEYKIIHRDIKPENILLDTSKDPVRPVLTDFGLVKLLEADHVTRLTGTGDVLGSYNYIAPEQWDNKTVTPVTDLYAFAIVFFEMLAGLCPFQGSSRFELMRQHCEADRPLLSYLAPNVGPFFDEVLLRAMAILPADRFQSVAEFIEAVEEANDRAEEAERRKIESQETATNLLRIARIDLQKKDYGEALKLVERALRTAQEDAPEYVVEALILRGCIYLEQEDLLNALDSYEQAYEQDGKPSSEAGINLLETLRKVADDEWRQKNYRKAIEYYDHIVEISDKDNSQDTRIQEIMEQVGPRLINILNEELMRVQRHHSRARTIIPFVALSALSIGGIVGILINIRAHQLRFLFVSYIILTLIYLAGYIIYYWIYEKPPKRGK